MKALAYIESLRPIYVREDHRLTKKSRMLACKILRMLRKYFSTSSGEAAGDREWSEVRK
jgi:hypothetical protein